MVCQGYGVTVAQRPSTPPAWVRILLPLPSYFVDKRGEIMTDLLPPQIASDIIKRMNPYLRPLNSTMEFI
jgi:hypothetical protein